MNKEQLDILTNIIGGVESGGQIYGKRRYEAYAAPYANSPNEHTITLGWAQNYGYRAQKLVREIYAEDREAFRKADTAGIEKKLSGSWEAEKWNPNEAQKKALIAIITTDAGKRVQDEMFIEDMEECITVAEAFGVTDAAAQMMWCEIQHLGGLAPTKRIFERASKPYTPDSIYASLLLDQRDTINNNQVGDKIYQSRHQCCVKWIKQYVQKTSTEKENVNMGVRMSNCGHDENNRYSGGKAGDQSGTEWYLCPWYAYPWNYIIRWKDGELANLFADLAVEAAQNSLIGYDQGQRDTFWQYLQACGYRPAKIKLACEADCSSGTIALIKAVGHLKGIKELQQCNATYTGNMMQYFQSAAGKKYFEVLTGKYLTNSNYAKRGDINLNTAHHVNVTVDNGANAGSTGAGTESSKSYLSKGDTGADVKTMQTMLIKLGYSCGAAGADGDFGAGTDAALRAFQKSNGLAVDGQYGSLSKSKLVNLYNKKVDNSTKKSVDEVAKEVIAGEWGTGNERMAALKKAGYDYDTIQKRVNEVLSGTSAKKSVTEVAKEVIQGKWGNGIDRSTKLEALGYDYEEVQKEVNKLLK